MEDEEEVEKEKEKRETLTSAVAICSVRMRAKSDKRLTNANGKKRNNVIWMARRRKEKHEKLNKKEEAVDIPNDVLFPPFSFHRTFVS